MHSDPSWDSAPAVSVGVTHLFFLPAIDWTCARVSDKTPRSPFFSETIASTLVSMTTAQERRISQLTAEDESFIPSLAHVLTSLVDIAPNSDKYARTRFHAVRPPSISIHDYLARIAKYFGCSQECFVLGLVYIDRIVKFKPEFGISNLNIHRLLVTSIMLAVKFFDDIYYSNAYYAKVGGVKPSEMNALEALFVNLIDWKLFVSPSEYEQYKNNVLRAVRGEMDNSPASPTLPLSGNDSCDENEKGNIGKGGQGPSFAAAMPSQPKTPEKAKPGSASRASDDSPEKAPCHDPPESGPSPLKAQPSKP